MPKDFASTDAARIVLDVRARLNRLVAQRGSPFDAPLHAEPVWIAPGGPRAVLAELFGLTMAELSLLDAAIAVQLEPSLGELVGDLQGWPRRPLPTETLVRKAFNLPQAAIWRPTSALARWQLVYSVSDPAAAAPSYRADPAIVDWMAGKAVLDQGIVGMCRLPERKAPTPEWSVDTALTAITAVTGAADGPLRLHILGEAGTGRSEYARSLVQAMGRDTLEIDGHLIEPDALGASYVSAIRFAVLTGRVPVWRSLPTAWPGHLPAPDLQIVTLTARSERPEDHAAVLDLRMPDLDTSERSDLWHQMTGTALPLSLTRATLAELRETAPLASAPGAIDLAVRDRALADLSDIGRVLMSETSWDDLVLPSQIRAGLEDYAAEARQFTSLSADPAFRRVFAKDGAPTALFSGPPGVGKTMAAECISGALGVPLVVIAVSRTVSKYIGETAKNLTRIFDAARRHGCILFFDEADAFFGKRTDVKDSNDRHANADTGHLLQLVENYEGMVVLGTNKRGHIDEAFLRRIRHVIEFPKPTSAERLRLWHRLSSHLFAPEELTVAAPALSVIAERLDLSPAQIKSAVLTATYTVRRHGCALDTAVLAAACARELRKEGRSLPPDLLQILEPRQEVSHVA